MKISILALLSLSFSLTAWAQSPAQSPVPKLKNVLWVWLENTPYATLINQKYLKNIWAKYPSVRLSKVLPVSKITQPNTVAMISGDDQGVIDNELTRLMAPTIVDLLESKNIPWRVYAEDYPGGCYQGAGSGNYKRYRAPFISVAKVQSDRYLCSKIVSFRNLDEDVRLDQLPQFAVTIPNLKTSGALDVGDAEDTVRRIIDPILLNQARLNETTIIISTTSNADPKKPEMYTLILGNGVAKAGQTVATPYNHYHLLRTIEEGLRLGHLNQNDSKAEPMVGFWAE